VLSVQEEQSIFGKRVLVVEDGPTLTHGEMAYGAAHMAARKFGAAEIVDPRPYAVGSIRDTFARFNHLFDVLPAMGYGAQQVRELEETINAVPCDLLNRLIKSRHPMLRVAYSLDPAGTQALERVLDEFLSNLGERQDDRKTLPVDPRPVHG
jgi:predicted GTPase